MLALPFSPLAALTALLAASTALARSATGDRVLVVRDAKYNSGYDKFFKSLTERGFELTFAEPKSDSAMLEGYGVALYDHLIIFAPETSTFSPAFTPQSILAAQSSYLNTLHILSPNLDDKQAATLREYDIEPTTSGSLVWDSFSHVAGGADSELVCPKTSLIAPVPVLSAATRSSAGPLVLGATGGFVTGENPFLIDVVSAPTGAYVGDAEGKVVGSPKAGAQVVLAGSKVSVVAAMQNRENVRIGFVGGPEMLADKWWGKKLDGVETGNRAVLEDLTKWLFQETGVVRVVGTHHHREGETAPRDEYTKKDTVNYEITLQQHTTGADGKTSEWAPFDVDDLQLEFTMLDPHIRTPLQPQTTSAADSTTYAAQFIAPDRHGVFKFVVEYWRPGFTYVRTADKASVVPLRHDEHERFITGAYPFYTGAVSTSAAFLLFVGVWMRLGEFDRGKKKAE